MVRLTVIVPTRNRARTLQACLRGLAGQTLPTSTFEILVVNNGSTDETGAVIDAWATRHPGVCEVEAPVAGLSRARNAGIAAARGEVLAFLDDDTVPEPRWLESLVGAYDRWPDVGMACGRALLRFQGPRPRWLGDELETWYSKMDFGPEPRLLLPRERPWGLNLSVRADLARAVGGFPEDLGRVERNLMSGEDMVFVAHVRAGGTQIAYEPDAMVWHEVSHDRLQLRWLLRRSWAQGRHNRRMYAAMEPRKEPQPTRPLRTAYRVTFRGWRSTFAKVRRASNRRSALTHELADRVVAIAQLSTEIKERAS